jgi:hypothetical protein
MRKEFADSGVEVSSPTKAKNQENANPNRRSSPTPANA